MDGTRVLLGTELGYASPPSMERSCSRVCTNSDSFHSPGNWFSDMSAAPARHGVEVAEAARSHGEAVQAALQRQMMVFENRIGKELDSLGNTWATAGTGLTTASSFGPAATQAALAAALEACVERISASEVWIGSVDMEARQLRIDIESSNRAIDGLASQVDALPLERQARDTEAHQEAVSGSTPPGHLRANDMMQRVERLEGELRQLAFKFDTGDAEIDNLKVTHAELINRRELIEVVETVRSDIDCLRQQLADTAEPLQQEMQLLSSHAMHLEGWESHSDFSAVLRHQLAESLEPLMQQLEHLGEFAAHAEKADRDAAEARKVGEGTCTVPGNELDTMTLLVREEVKSMSRAVTRHELQEATKLLREIKDAGKILKQEIQSVEAPNDIAVTQVELYDATEALRQELGEFAPTEPIVTRQEFDDATQSLRRELAVLGPNENIVALVTRQEFQDATGTWKQELRSLAAELSEQIRLAGAPRELPMPMFVTRKELTEIVDLLRQEVETLTRRLEQDNNGVSRSEFAEAVKFLKQDLLLLANKAAQGDLVSRQQELIDLAQLMKHELRGFSERGAVSQQDLTCGLEELKQDVLRRIQRKGGHSGQEVTTWLEVEPLTVRSFEVLWRDKLSATLKQELLRELEHESFHAKSEHQRLSQCVKALEDRFRDCCTTDITQSSDDVSELLLRVNSLGERLLAVERRLDPSTQTPATPTSGSVLQVPLYSSGEDSSSLGPQQDRTCSLRSSNGYRSSEYSEADHSNHLEKNVEDLRKRVKVCEDAVVRLTKGTPRGTVGAEGLGQLMAAVKKDQETESVVVEQLLARISSVCNSVVSVERQITTAAENAESMSKQAASSVEEVTADMYELKTRLEALEGAAS